MVKTLSDVLCSTMKNRKKEEGYLSQGGRAYICSDGRGRGVNLHTESEKDPTTVEDPFTQTLVQSLEKRQIGQFGLLQLSLDPFDLVGSNHAQPKTRESCRTLNIGDGLKRTLEAGVRQCYEWNLPKKYSRNDIKLSLLYLVMTPQGLELKRLFENLENIFIGFLADS